MRLRLALLSLFLLSVPALPGGTATDGPSAVRRRPAVTVGAALPGGVGARPSPASPTPKLATPIRPSLITAAETSLRATVSAAVSPLEAIRWCESRDDYHAENPDSSASGAFQFIDSTWRWVTGLRPPASAHPRPVQDAAFRRLWDGGDGADHWAPSSHCWEPLLEGGQ